MVDFIVLLLIVPFALILFSQLKTLRCAKGSEGQMAPDTTLVDGGIGTPSRVYFFHATHCVPCRSLMTLVDSLRQNYSNLIKVDVTMYPELARNFGIVAIPSFITVTDGLIRKVQIGARNESWLRAQLKLDTET